MNVFVLLQPPKARGRAHMLEALRKMQKLRVGSGEESTAKSSYIAQPPEPDTKEFKPSDALEPVNKIHKDFIGTSGKTVPASANYIRLSLEPGFGVYQYEVIFKPDVDSENARFKLVNSVILEYSTSKTFDGRLLFLPVKICEDSMFFNVTHPYDNSDVSLSVVFRKQVPFQECTTLFNLLFNRVMRVLKYKRVRRQFFDEKHPIPIPQHKLEIWPGYVTTVSECTGGLMLCLDVAHRLLRTQTVLEYMAEVMQTQRDRAKDTISKALIGSVVMTQYNNRSYVVHDICWDVTPQSAFNTATGEIRYMDYYKKQYDINIKDIHQPMLLNRKTVRKNDKQGQDREEQIVGLVPELCFMTGLTDALRADHRVMKDVAQYTRITPHVRMNSLRKFVNSVRESKEAADILNGWGLRIHQATIDIKMRILSPEVILFGDDVTVQGTEKADWTGAVMKNKVLSAIDMYRWLVLYTAQDEAHARSFIDNMLRLAPRMGINIAKPEMFRMPDDRTETYMRILQQKIDENLQVVVIICPTNRDDRYMAVKKICCHKCPVASQVINARTLKNPKKLTAIVQKIALQMNCKLGGTLWSVKFPFKNWMICGIDVYHSAGQATGRAVCGFVASLNDSMTRWFSTSSFHSSDKEISDHIKPMFIKALNEYRHANLDYPSHVIIYRDGVGDGQLNACREFEMKQLRLIADEMGLNIKFVFIVIQKRINTRIFSTGRMCDNPPAGSIVDTDITRPYLHDFFLVPQSVNQGTVTPTHYIILENEPDVKPDHIQRLSYKLCHMYYNWTGTVRVPAPCQYAHKLAYLIGQHVRADASDKLNTKLFYL